MRKVDLFLLFLPILILGSCNQEQDQSPYIISTKDFIWLDKSRIDPEYGGRRLLNVRIWYPADTTALVRGTASLQNTPYHYHLEDAWEELSHWNEAELNMLNEVQTRSFVQLPVYERSEKFPLILFSPSLGGNLFMYTTYAEELAMQGYVVMGVNHLYESEYVFDPKHRLYSGNFSFHDSLKSLQIPDEITVEEYRAEKGKRQKVLAEDLLFCMDELQNREEEIISSMADFERIGVFGHSIGGSAAIYSSVLDERIDAVVDIDGTPPSVALENGIESPLLFIEDLIPYQTHSGYMKVQQRRNEFCEKTGSFAYRFLFADTDHNSFMDIHQYQAATQDENLSSHELINDVSAIMIDFFDASLNGNDPNFTAQMSDSLEVFSFKKK